ncbi:MAG: hypothetical protein V4487_04070, partial [Chlamydiota bacterium]
MSGKNISLLSPVEIPPTLSASNAFSPLFGEGVWISEVTQHSSNNNSTSSNKVTPHPVTGGKNIALVNDVAMSIILPEMIGPIERLLIAAKESMHKGGYFERAGEAAKDKHKRIEMFEISLEAYEKASRIFNEVAQKRPLNDQELLLSIDAKTCSAGLLYKVEPENLEDEIASLEKTALLAEKIKPSLDSNLVLPQLYKMQGDLNEEDAARFDEGAIAGMSARERAIKAYAKVEKFFESLEELKEDENDLRAKSLLASSLLLAGGNKWEKFSATELLLKANTLDISDVDLKASILFNVAKIILKSESKAPSEYGDDEKFALECLRQASELPIADQFFKFRMIVLLRQQQEGENISLDNRIFALLSKIKPFCDPSLLVPRTVAGFGNTLAKNTDHALQYYQEADEYCEFLVQLNKSKKSLIASTGDINTYYGKQDEVLKKINESFSEKYRESARTYLSMKCKDMQKKSVSLKYSRKIDKVRVGIFERIADCFILKKNPAEAIKFLEKALGTSIPCTVAIKILRTLVELLQSGDEK